MPLLIFIGAILVIVAGPLVWFLFRSKLSRGATELVLVGTAAGEAESRLWVTALGTAGISSHVRNVGDFGRYGTSPYAYDVWVRERDADRARDVLGF